MWRAVNATLTNIRPAVVPRPSIARRMRIPRKMSSSDTPVARKITRVAPTTAGRVSSEIHGSGRRM